MRLSQLARKLNVGIATIVDFLIRKGYEVENKPNTKISDEQIVLLNKEFAGSIEVKQASEEVEIKKVQTIVLENEEKEKEKEKEKEPETAPTTRLEGPKVLGKVDLSPKKKVEEKPKAEEPKKVE